MTGRPALTLVGPPPQVAGRRALEFIRWAVEHHGLDGGEPGKVVIHKTQVALAAAYYRKVSERTVSWYLGQLRSVGVVLSRGPIAVDVELLEELTGAGWVTGARSRAPVSRNTSPAYESAAEAPIGMSELLAQRAEQTARLAQLQAEIALTDVAIVRAVEAGERRGMSASIVRGSANPGLADSRKTRGKLADQEGRKVDLNPLPSFPDSLAANRDRGSANSPRIEAEWSSGESGRIPLAEIDELVEPLRALCRATKRPDHLDANGRATLAALGRDVIETGLENFIPEVEADLSIHSPVRLFVHRAQRGDPDTFNVRRSANQGSAGRADPEPAAIVIYHCESCGGSGTIHSSKTSDGRSRPCSCRPARGKP